jgi:NitT/TauT family transport system substrate-binding protein
MLAKPAAAASDPTRRAALSRRTVLTGLAAAPFILRAGRASAAPLRELTLWGPPAGPSVVLTHAVASGLLKEIADKATFKAWRNPDELRAGLTSGTMQTFVLPVQTAANLFNRGLNVRLVNVMTDGLLYLVAADPALNSIPALKGRKVALPFRGDTMEATFRRLLQAHGMAGDADDIMQFLGTPMEAVQLLAAGRVDAALLPEPAATAAILRASVGGKALTRVINIQQAWGHATGLPPSLPQAGLGVSEAFLRDHPDKVAALHAALATAAASVNAQPARAANDAAPALGLPQPVIEASIPYSSLRATPARDIRPALENVFRAVMELDPKIIGGALPADGFYL